NEEAWGGVSLHYYSRESITGPLNAGRDSGSVLEMSRRSVWPSMCSFGNLFDPSARGRSLMNPTKSKSGPGISVFGVPDVFGGSAFSTGAAAGAGAVAVTW